jgi:Ca2+-binding EF-hand superfamily protein
MGSDYSVFHFPSVKEAKKMCSEEEWKRYERSFTKLTRLNKGKLPLHVYQTQVLPFLNKELIRCLFDVIDKRQKGFLSKDDFLVGTTIVAHGTTTEKLWILFCMYDRSQTGKLTARDLRPFLNLFDKSDPEMSRIVLSHFNMEMRSYSRYGLPIETEMDFQDWERLFERLTDGGARKLPIFSWIFDITPKEEATEKWDLPEKFWMRSNSLANITEFDKRELAELEMFWENNLKEESIDKDNLEVIETFFHHEIPKELLQRVFESFDPWKKGSINTRDFIVGLSACVRGTEKDRLEFAFRAYAGEDNTLDSASLSVMLKALWTMIDLQEDQSECEEDVSSTEKKVLKLHRLKTMNGGHSDQVIPALVKSIFKHYDVDEDGKISFKEFRNWTIDNPAAMDFVNTLSAVTSKYWLRPTTREEEGMIVEEFMAEMACLTEAANIIS